MFSNLFCSTCIVIIRDDYRKVRQSVVDMVLATDMTKHFEYLKKFENLMKVMAVDTLVIY